MFVKAQSEGSLQGSIGQIVIMAYLFVTTWLRPFAKAEDNGLQIASLIGAQGGCQWRGMPGIA